MSIRLAALQPFEIESARRQSCQQCVVGPGIDRWCAGKYPQVVPARFADRGQLVGLVEVDHPVIAPDKGQEGQSRRRKTHLQLRRGQRPDLARQPHRFDGFAVGRAAAVRDRYLTGLCQPVIRPRALRTFALEPVWVFGNFVPGAHVTGHVEGCDGFQRGAGIALLLSVGAEGKGEGDDEWQRGEFCFHEGYDRWWSLGVSSAGEKTPD